MNSRPVALSGYSWALVSTACLSTVYIFSKHALQTLSRATFLPLWFLVGTLASFSYLSVSHQRRQVLAVVSIWRQILLIGLLESISMFAFFLEIELIDPTLVSFFNNMTTVYEVIFGIVFFQERLTNTELSGMLLVLIGACIITYRAGNGVLLAFILAIFVHTLFRALSYVIAKPAATRIGPEALIGFRNLTMFVSSAAYALVLARDNLQIPSVNTAVIIFAGAVLGPFLGIMLLYRAFSLTDLAKVGIIQGSVPVFVLISTYLAFGTLPSPHQIMGGIMTIVGVFTLYAGRGDSGGKKASARNSHFS